MAAEGYLGETPLIKDVDIIQNLLVIARFGMYYHIGTSLWDISHLCMRQCNEWRLHVSSSRCSLEPFQEQHHRRIFWECYVLERYSSGILGRPFAIADSEATVPLPIDFYDEAITSSRAKRLDQILRPANAPISGLFSFIFNIKLRRISSRIHSTFYRGQTSDRLSETRSRKSSNIPTIGHVYAEFSHFHKELDVWRHTAPEYRTPRSLYEQPEWHDFLYEKYRLLLARGAMHNIPSRPFFGSGVTKEILTACYASATKVISLYADLLKRGLITCTRSYFQVIFTAGLTVIYCIGLDVLKDHDEIEIGALHPVQILGLCSSVLSVVNKKMPDAGSFAVLLDALKDECIKDRFNVSIQPLFTSYDTITDMNHVTHQEQTGRQVQGVVQAAILDDTLTNVVTLNNNEMAATTSHLSIGHSNYPDHVGVLPDYGYDSQDLSLGLTDELIHQLEAGLGESAWGSINIDGIF